MLTTLVFTGAPVATAAVVETRLVSRAIDGSQGNGHSPHEVEGGPRVGVSANGRYVVFTSSASNLLGVEGDMNDAVDVFRHDRLEGTLELVSQGRRDGQPTEGNGDSGISQVDVSADGNLVVFDSFATILTDDDVPSEASNVFVRDIRHDRTVLVSYDGEGAVNGSAPAISSDGRYVAFENYGVLRRVELLFDEDGALRGPGRVDFVAQGAYNPSLSGNGRFVLFDTPASLVEIDQTRDGDDSDVYRWDAEDWYYPYELVSVAASGTSSGNGPSVTSGPRALADDGRTAGFRSDADDLLRTDDRIPPSGLAYVRSFWADDFETMAVPRGPDGLLYASGPPQLSRDGDRAVFTSNQPFLVEPPVTDNANVYVARLRGLDGDEPMVTLGSRSDRGESGNDDSGAGVLDGDGDVLAFGSHAENLADGDDNGEADVFVRASTLVDPVADLTLTVDEVAGPTGITAVDLGDVDLSGVPFLPGALEAAPLRASPLRASPLRASPLRASPLRASPLRASPLRASPLRASPLRASPLRASSLPPMPLSTIALLRDGGWPALLAGPPATPYAGLPVQSVTLQQVLSLPEGLYPQVDALTLEDIDVTATPLAEASLQTFLFSGPSLAALAPGAGWCSRLAAEGFVCADHGITEATSTLLDLVFAGAPEAALTFVSDLLVRDADLTGAPVAAYDVASVDVDATALGALPVSALPAGIVDCGNPGTFPCGPTATLGGAVAAGAVLDAPSAVLGRILSDDALVGYLTFGDVVRMLVDPAKLSYADVPLVPLLLGTEVTGQQRFTASATVLCADADALSFQVVLPRGFRYLEGSTTLRFDGVLVADPGDPSQGGSDFHSAVASDDVAFDEVPPTILSWWDIGDTCPGEASVTSVALSFLVDPWVELGSRASSVTLWTRSSEASATGVAPFVVEDAREPDDEPAQATVIEPGVLTLSHLGSDDAIDHFEVRDVGGAALERGSIVTATLGHLPADFDLRLDGPAIAPLRASPLRASPLRASPIEDPGLSIDPSGQAVGPDLVEDVPRTENTRSQSAYRGLESETVSMVVPPGTGEPFTLAVSSYLGATSDRPYSLQVMVEPPPELTCVPQTAFAGAGAPGTLPATGSIDPATRTLVLVNEQRFDVLHGAGATQQVRDALAAAIPGGDHAGPFAVLPVDGSAAVRGAYSAWDADPCEPERANDVVRAILGTTDAYTTTLPDLRFVVVVGDDNVLPAYRVPDATTLANQRDYYPELVLGGLDNPLSAAAAFGYVLTDNAYTELDAVAFLDHELLIPDLAGGRLVETLPEILGTIDRYATQKHLDVDSSLLAAYDFLTDGGQDAHDVLASRPGGDPDKARALISDTWTKSELLGEIGLAPDITGVWAHYDHSRLLTAAGDGLPNPVDEIASTTEALAAGLAQGTLFFTLGCNAGLNVPALAWVGATPEEALRLLDWPQATAQRAGAFFGNTGFGYGDDVVSAYGERLMTLFAEGLDGSMTVGQAAAAARHAYLEEAALDVYTAKTIASGTLYGLPFVRVGATGQVGPAPAAAPRPPAETGPITTDPLTGRPSTAFDLTPSFDRVTTARGEYDVASVGGQEEPTLKALYRPVQPAITLNLPAPPAGGVTGDLLVTGLESQDSALIDPVFVRPTFDLAANEPEPLVRDVAHSVSLGNVTPTGNLLLHAGQLRRTTLDNGTQTRYTRITGRVLFGAGSDPLDRPTFEQVEALRSSTSGATGFEVVVGAADLVLVLYKGSTGAAWRSLRLTQSPSGAWTGGVPHEVTEYFVQAVRGAAVASARGKGLNFEPTEIPGECSTFPLARAELDALVAAGGITPSLETKIRHALEMAELWLTEPRKRGPALSHLDRAIHLLEWQADVVEKGKPNQGNPAGLRALAATIGRLRDCV